MTDVLSRNDKIALVRLTEGSFSSAKDLAKDMDIDPNYANNILTKLKRLGYIEKRWTTVHQVVIPVVTPDEKLVLASVLRKGAINNDVIPIYMRRIILGIANKISPTFISMRNHK